MYRLRKIHLATLSHPQDVLKIEKLGDALRDARRLNNTYPAWLYFVEPETEQDDINECIQEGMIPIK